MKQINIGILGTSAIAHRALIEPSKKLEEAYVYGIASREKDKAKLYSEKYSIPHCFSSYDELLQCNEIEAVYIPLISSLHAEYTIKAIEAKKNVLVEKPICFTSKEIANIKSALEKNNIILLEGLMSQHHPWVNKLKEIIKEKTYGDIKSIKTKACYNLDDPNDFRLFPEKGGSVFYEEGLLWCHITQLCLGLNPLNYEPQCKFNGPNGGDHTFETKLYYPGGVTSELFCSYANPYQADHFIEFEKANIKIKNFWRPTFGEQKLKLEIKKHNSDDVDYYSFESNNYFSNQLVFFLDVIQGRKNNIPLTNSFERIKIMEKIFLKSKEKQS